MKSKILIRKGKKEYFKDMDKEITIVKERSFFVADSSKDFSTDAGMISKTDLKKKGMIKSAKGKDFCVFDAGFVDNYKRLPRLAQMIPLKDVGYIIVQTGIGPDTTVVEGGSGSGGFCIQAARFAKKIISYDIEKEHIALVKDNAKSLNIKNITFKNKSLYDGIDEKNVDVILFDLPEPWRAVEHALKAIKIGGFVVSYSPTIIQSHQFVDKAMETKQFAHLRTTEILDRPWLCEGRRVRPISKEVLHSGFISIMRRIC